MLGPDHRTIVIQEYAETADLTNSNPDQVTVFVLPTMMGVEPDMEELSGTVKDSLRSADVYPYALRENHTQFNWGASSSGQEIIVQLLSDPYIRMAAEQSVKGLSFGAASGAASLFVQQVIKRVQRIRKHESEKSKQHVENVFQDYGTDLSEAPTSVEFNLDRWVALGKYYTANAYGLDQEKLDHEGTKHDENGTQTTLINNVTGSRFGVRMEEEEGVMYIRRLRPQ